MEESKKKERVELLLAIGREVREQALSKHVGAGGDPAEIMFDESAIPALVEEYSRYIESWRSRHIDAGKLIDGDKIAAITGTLIMRHEVFYSETGAVNTEFAALANELFAVRVAQLFVQKNTFGFTPPEHKMLMYCFSHCNDYDPAMLSWTVATMSQHRLRSCVKEPIYAD